MTTNFEDQVRTVLSGPWQIVSDFTVQGYALWETQGKSKDKPWTPAKRRTTAKQCAACGAIFGGVTGFEKHRKGVQCTNPTDTGLSRAADGVWVLPRPEFTVAEGCLAVCVTPANTVAAGSA